jgi:hypothetical protein
MPSEPAASPSSSAAPQPVETPVPPEKNPPGDIPDNVAFVTFTSTAGGYRFVYPESFARTERATRVHFTDKLNGIDCDVFAAGSAPTEQTARHDDVPRLQRSIPAFELRSVTSVSLPGGNGVRIVFRRNSEPDPVTGRVYRDEVEEYEIWSGGREVRLDLYGPVGADNVDAYRMISRSLRLS